MNNFLLLESSARVKAILRRIARSRRPDVLQFGGGVINFPSREVLRSGKTVELTSKEFDLLAYPVRRPGEAISREKLFVEVWGHPGYEYEGSR